MIYPWQLNQLAFIKNAHLRPPAQMQNISLFGKFILLFKFISRGMLRIFGGLESARPAIFLVAAEWGHSRNHVRPALIGKLSHIGILTLKLVWFGDNLSDNHCGIISGIVSRHSLVKVHPKCWSVKWLKVYLTTFFDFFDTQAWKYVPKCPTYPYFPRLSDRLSHFSRHYPRQITITLNYCISRVAIAEIDFSILLEESSEFSKKNPNCFSCESQPETNGRVKKWSETDFISTALALCKVHNV